MAPAVSLGIELVQLTLCCGLFEFDDVMHNSIGALIGFLPIRILEKNKKNKNSNCEEK